MSFDNKSTYYDGNGIEAIDVIEAFGLGFNLGNAVKYILRFGKKTDVSDLRDLEKAVFYLKREIGLRQKTGENV